MKLLLLLFLAFFIPSKECNYEIAQVKINTQWQNQRDWHDTYQFEFYNDVILKTHQKRTNTFKIIYTRDIGFYTNYDCRDQNGVKCTIQKFQDFVIIEYETYRVIYKCL